MQETFNEDLASGKEIEHEVCAVLRKKYPKAYVVGGYCKEYDIVIPEIKKTVEVKLDERSHDTGNFLIETEFDGKPSALATTEADIWIIVDKNHYYITQPLTLSWLLREVWKDERGKPYISVSFVGTGDKKAKKAYLIPKRHFESRFIRKVKRPTKG